MPSKKLSSNILLLSIGGEIVLFVFLGHETMNYENLFRTDVEYFAVPRVHKRKTKVRLRKRSNNTMHLVAGATALWQSLPTIAESSPFTQAVESQYQLCDQSFTNVDSFEIRDCFHGSVDCFHGNVYERHELNDFVDEPPEHIGFVLLW